MTQADLPPHLSPQDVSQLLQARHNAPFDVLGLHKQGRKAWAVALLPDAVSLQAIVGKKTVDLPRIEGALFGGPVPVSKTPHRLRAVFSDGQEWEFDDAYRFGPVLGDVDAYLIGEGTHRRLWDALGAHVIEHEGVQGTHFAVWAPSAARVSVIGDFNQWDGRRHPMRRVGVTGVWELFIPGIGDGALYKYEIAPQHLSLIHI